jgi:hypothetical protein
MKTVALVSSCLLSSILLCLVLLMLQSRPVVSAALANAANPQNPAPASITAQIVVTPSRDNTIYESPNGGLSNGAGIAFFAGKTGAGSIVRGLLGFDLAERLPVSATVATATLKLNVNTPKQAGTRSIRFHRLSRDWGEGDSNADKGEGGGASATTGDATWLHSFFNTQFWQNPGGDFAESASFTITVSANGVYTHSSEALLADVQGWLANPDMNFGWVIIGDEAAGATAKRFASKEDAANAPQLVIEYTGVTEEQKKVFLPLIGQ